MNPIESMLGAYAQAHFDRDAIALGKLYEDGAVICDMAPPLLRTGLDRESTKAWFDSWDGPIRMEFRETKSYGSHDLLVIATLVKLSGSKDGTPQDVWTRGTFVLRNLQGSWRIAHEHASVPFHMDGSLRAAIDLMPSSA